MAHRPDCGHTTDNRVGPGVGLGPLQIRKSALKEKLGIFGLSRFFWARLSAGKRTPLLGSRCAGYLSDALAYSACGLQNSEKGERAPLRAPLLRLGRHGSVSRVLSDRSRISALTQCPRLVRRAACRSSSFPAGASRPGGGFCFSGQFIPKRCLCNRSSSSRGSRAAPCQGVVKNRWPFLKRAPLRKSCKAPSNFARNREE